MLILTAHLLRFFGPSQVICAWFDSCEFLDYCFKSRPETDHLKRIIQPASGDAEVGLVWRNVMDAMMLPGQNDVRVL